MSDRCTADQAQLIDRLIRSHVFTPAERRPILEHLAAGTLTVQRASDGIEWAFAAIKERKASEKQRERERNHNWLDMARDAKAAGVDLMS